MGKIDEVLEAFIRAQQMFFVATAPLNASGHINLSLKGLDTRHRRPLHGLTSGKKNLETGRRSQIGRSEAGGLSDDKFRLSSEFGHRPKCYDGPRVSATISIGGG